MILRLLVIQTLLVLTKEVHGDKGGGQGEYLVVSDARWPRSNSSQSKRFIRRTRGHTRTEACDMLIAIDEPLYVTYHKDLVNLTSMVQLYVKQLNEIYHSKVLLDRYNDVYFRLKEIRILFDFCTECNHTQQVFLEEFTKMDTSHFCLAHIFTFRDFPAGIQGLAYKGTICSSSHNTGFTTFLNHRVKSSASDSVMTFAHEVGHNLGAEHDEDAGCTSGYIMSESGSTKISHMDQEFSSCSIKAIHSQIDYVKTYKHRNCFKHREEKTNDNDFSICGDYKVEGEEECDCGMSYETCSDPCCYSAHISPDDLAWNASAVPCRRHRSPVCLNPFRSALTFGLIVPWIFIGLALFSLIIGLCYDWHHKQKCFKHHTSGPIIESNSHHKRISKSEPRSTSPPLVPPMASPRSPPTAVTSSAGPTTSIQVTKPKAPPPPPPLVAPYLPPMRSQSQPPPMNRNIAEQPPPFMVRPQLTSSLSRPPDPPPPIPESPVKAKSPPLVPYGTRPHISEVAYLRKKFEESSS